MRRGIDALIGDEEQRGKQKRMKRRRGSPKPITLDHLVVSYDPQGSYNEPKNSEEEEKEQGTKDQISYLDELIGEKE